MAAIPTWLIGRGVTLVTITPQTVATDGTLTPGTTASLTGKLDSIELEATNNTENIVPLDNRYDNEVIIGTGTRVTLNEIISSNGTGFNILATASANDYNVFTFTRAGKAWTMTGVTTGYHENISRGKCTGSMTLAPAGINSSYA